MKSKNKLFKKRVAHGMLTASTISTVLGTKLPGLGCIYIRQNLHFRRPVFLNDEVTTIATVKELIPEKNASF